MTEYFQKARELGQLILRSDEAMILAEANVSGNDIPKAKYDYDALVNQIINMIKATAYEELTQDGGHNCGGCCNKQGSHA